MEPIGPQGHEPIVNAQIALQPLSTWLLPAPAARRAGDCCLFFILLLVMALGFSFLLNLALLRQSDPFPPGAGCRRSTSLMPEFQTGTDKIAIVSVDGVILSYEGYLKQQIDQAGAR